MPVRPSIRVRIRPATKTALSGGVAEAAVATPLPQAPKFECVTIDALRPAANTVRKHPKMQVEKLIRTIERFGYIALILVDRQRQIIDGHLLWAALKKMGHKTVQVQVIDHLSEPEVDTLRIALHALTEMSQWDDDGLKIAVDGLFRLDPLLIEYTALPTARVDALMLSGFEKLETEEAPTTLPKSSRMAHGDSFVPESKEIPPHRLVCGDAKDPEVIARALAGRPVRMLLADLPYCLVPIKGVASGRHEDFVEGASLNEAESLTFFNQVLAASVPHIMAGGSAYLFIDHRGMFALTQATRDQGLAHVCTAVLDKEAGGMGGLYRHQVEFVLVMAKGDRIEVNNVKLGKYGRNRTTLWRCRGMAQFGPDRAAALEAHPTVKPVQICADAILDVTNIGDVVLDPCMGTGTAVIGAHRVNRVGVGVELDPVYFETAVRRLEKVIGVPMIHEETGLTLEALIARRAADAASKA